MARDARSDWLWFFVWVLSGLAAAGAAIAAGPLLFLPAAAIAAWFLFVRRTSSSGPRLLGGVVAMFMLYMVWENFTSHDQCWAGSATVEPHCEMPNHFGMFNGFVVGALLLVAGIVIQARRLRRSRRPSAV